MAWRQVGFELFEAFIDLPQLNIAVIMTTAATAKNVLEYVMWRLPFSRIDYGND